jgi:secreted Zn-dependent insulinase-like peptidase
MNNIKYKRKVEKIIKNIKQDINIVTSGDSEYPIYKYERDKLRYIKKILDNGLEVLFIEDDKAVQSEVYMNVKVGHDQNPEEYPGLAHFLEHMLFIGSEKYPNFDIYSRLIAENNGHSNAYTTSDHTLYYFGCRSDLLFKIIDIFCNFFISPLFHSSKVQTEISAVNSEHEKNIGDDFARRWSLVNVFIKDKINSSFATGNTETLDKDGIMEALKKFYKKYYTVDRMMLIIVHNNINNKFISTIANIFGKISNNKSSIDINEIYPISINKVDGFELIKAEKIEDGSEMMIRFFLPDSIKNRKIIDRSYHILSYILNHSGEQSLYNHLSKTNIIKSISAGIGNIYTGDIGYDIIVNLTDYGFSIYNDVILLIIGYINRINTINNDQDIFNTYQQEIYDIDVLNVNTMSRISGASVADDIIDIYNSFGIDNQYVRIHGMLEDIPKMNKHFKSMLDNMINHTQLRMKVILMSNKIDPNSFDKIDKYYNTKYSVGIEKFNPVSKKKYFNISYKMPELNSYIPDKLDIIIPIKSDIIPIKTSIKTDIKLEDLKKIDDPDEFVRLNSDKGNYYHLLKSNTYGTHYAYGAFNILLSSMSDKLNPINVILIELYFRLIIETYQSDLSMSSAAGNSIYVSRIDRGIRLQFKAFDNKLEKLLTNFLNWFYNPGLTIEYNTYQKIYTTMRNNFLNYEKSKPFTRLHSMLEDFVDPVNNISNSQYLYAIQLFDPKLMQVNNEINFNNLQERTIELINTGSIRGVMAGSIQLNTAKNVVKIVDSYYNYSQNFKIRRIKNPILNCNPSYDKDCDPNYKSYSSKNKYGDDLVYTERLITSYNKNEQDDNIGLSYSIYLGEYVRSEYVSTDEKTNYNLREPLAYIIPGDVIGQHFFNEMRTTKEYGYFVKAGLSGIVNSGTINLFLKFDIQTPRIDKKTGKMIDILNIIRNYVDTEVLDIVLNLDESQVQKTINTYIKNTFKEYSSMGSKFADACSIQSSFTYDDLNKIGTEKYLNRLQSIDAYNELKEINASMVHDLYKKAILNNPRYIVMITPNNSNK